jgi:hypothetical protein
MSFLNLPSKKIATSLILGMLLSCGSEQQRVPQAPIAENSIFQFSEHTIYLSTNKTSDLSKNIAKKYNIERKNNLIMLNASILKNSINKSVSANINIEVKNLLGQIKKTTKLVITENEFISAVSNQETLLYSIQVSPEDQYIEKIQYQKKFYIN